MGFVIAKENFPELANSSGTSGKRRVLFLNYGTGATAENKVWEKVGGVKNYSFNVSAEVSSVQTKDNGYWPDGSITSKTAELSAEVIAKKDNEAQAAIEHFIYDDETTAEKNALNFAIVDLDTLEYIEFWCCPTSWETTADSEDLVQKSLSATVVGKPEKKTGFVVPGEDASLPGVSFSKAAAADVVLTVPSGTITGLKKGDTDVNSSNYSIALGAKSIVILGSYLDDLDNGATTFYIQMSGGSAVSCVITISA